MIKRTALRTALFLAFAQLGANAVALEQAAPATATATAPAAAFNLEADVQRTLKLFDIPGIAIAIVKDGKVVTQRGFGVRKLGEPAPVDEKTMFEIASNSKLFTAVALAMLVDEGKLAWDDAVIKHLPDFQMYDAYVTREMTVRDLLVHRSGLGLGAGDLLWWPATEFTTDDIIRRLRFIKPATSFRSAYAYDNLLYIVAGKIIASKSGKSWAATIRERILAPVGMTTTTADIPSLAANRNVSAAHSKVDGKNTVVRAMPVANADGAVGVSSNAEDLAKWMNVLLDGGVVSKDKRLYSAAQAREIWTPQTPMQIGEPKPVLAATRPNFLAYGLGVQIRDYKGQRVIQHSGALAGYFSRVIMVPESKLGIAILTNAENGRSMQALQFQIMDHYMGGNRTDWIAAFHGVDVAAQQADKAAQKASSAKAAKSSPSLPLSAYDGDYEDAWYGLVSIKPEGGKHVMRFSKTADLTGELVHFQHDTFIVRWNNRSLYADAYVTFALNPDGSIDQVKMKPVSSETDFSYDFQDLLLTPVKKAAK